MIPLNLVSQLWRSLLRWIDGWVEPPIMRTHVNEGSYEYFGTEDGYRDRSPLGDLVGDHPHEDE